MQTITSLVDKTNVVADVGCDHGKLGVTILLQNKADKVLFCDISAPSLEKARALTQEEGLSQKAQFFCQDGLGDVKCNTAIIAGMGGMEILSIIKNASFLPDTLILQPMKDSSAIRKTYERRGVSFCRGVNMSWDHGGLWCLCSNLWLLFHRVIWTLWHL